MEPMRRSALVEATISEIGRAGSLDVTVSQIAKKAGVSSGLAHHYFGSKDQIFLAAMRHILVVFGAEVRGALLMATTPYDRLQAIIRSCFSPQNFRPEVVSAWLSFYVLAQQSDDAKRLLRIYHLRLNSNLIFALKAMQISNYEEVAETIASLIDGVYIRQALQRDQANAQRAVSLITAYLDSALEGQKAININTLKESSALRKANNDL